MSKASLLIIGCGAIGEEMARQRSSASAWQMTGLRRRPEQISAAGLQILAGDYSCSDSLCSAIAPLRPDYVLLTLTPAQYTEHSYRNSYVSGVRNVLLALEHRPKRILFVSSTSVYGQTGGEWIDENSAAEAQSFSGATMRECEQMLAGSEIPATALRCGGIYGGASQRLLNRIREGRFSAGKNYSNRIHLYDCAAALWHLLERDVAGQELADCYLLVDSEPCLQSELESWLAAQLGRDYRPPEPDADTAKGQRNAGSKRCLNARLLATGFEFRYPGFRQGYAQLLKAL